MKDIKTFVIGFLTCCCMFLIMGQNIPPHLRETEDNFEGDKWEYLTGEWRDKANSDYTERTTTLTENFRILNWSDNKKTNKYLIKICIIN